MNTRANPLDPYPSLARIRTLDRWALMAALISLGMGFSGMAFLPEMVPMHFNFLGEVDSYSSRWVILVLPLMGLAMYGFFRLIDRAPETFNYPFPIDDSNRVPMYALGRHLLVSINLFIQVAFLLLHLQILRIALGHAERLSVVTIPVGLGILALIIFWHRRRMDAFKPATKKESGS